MIIDVCINCGAYGTECQEFHDEHQSVEVCQVDSSKPDPNQQEDAET